MSNFRFWFERSLPPAYLSLLEGHSIVGVGRDTPDDQLRHIHQAEAIIASSRIQYDASVFNRASALRVISRTGIGCDNIDLDAATAHGIAVCVAPGAGTCSVAEHALGMIFALSKQFKWCGRVLQDRSVTDFFNANQGRELAGQRLGIVGFGQIGRQLAVLALGIGLEVCVYDPFVDETTAASINVKLATDLDDMLPECDIVSLHLPLQADTHHLINTSRLAGMKQGALVINCSRGSVVDEDALLEALERGQIGGAGLDVFEVEPPPPDHPLLHREDVIATPHVAAATLQGKDRLWRTAIKQAFQVLNKQRPTHLANPEVVFKTVAHA